MSLFKKLVISFSLVTFVPLFFIFLLSNSNFRESLLSIQRSSLEQITNIKTKQITDYFAQFKKEIAITQDYFNIKTNLPIIADLASAPDSAEYVQAKKMLDEQLRAWIQKREDVVDIMLTNVDGIIVYTLNNEQRSGDDVGRPLSDPNNTAWLRGREDVFVSDLFYNKEDDVAPFYFLVTAPIHDFQGNFTGVVVFEVNASELYALIQNTDGLGATGETLIGERVAGKTNGADGETKDYVLFLNPLRHDAGAAFTRTAVIGDSSAVPMQEAAEGRNGTGITLDYRGTEVLAVWRYLPENNWGMVTKIDLAELLLPVLVVEKAILVFCLAAFFITLIVAWLLARIISSPILTLKLGVEKIKQGDFNYQVNIRTKDEIEQLADSFNEMKANLKKSNFELQQYSHGLEEKVAEKTKYLQEKIEDLNKTREAVLNLAEDAEMEKNNAKRLAHDLEKYRLAIDSAQEQIMITDKTGAVIYCNPATEKMTGYSIKEAIGVKAGKMWGGRMKKDFYEKMWKTILIDKEVFSGELTNVRKNGEVYTASLSISPMLDEAGEVEFFVAIERDVTREREIDRMKSEFVSVASHQLRTPLTGIKWFTELLLKSKISNTVKDYVGQIATSNERMVRLVDDLLNVSRIDTGHNFEVVKIKSDIAKVIKQVVAEQNVIAQAKKIKVKFMDGCVKKLDLLIDAEKMHQVFQNLINNALKYSKVGGKVEVGCKIEKDLMIFYVKDQGIGIPQKQQHRIFEKFFRAENVFTVHTDGTGLGLYIVKAIVEAHGGKVWFESVENKGTTFFVSLPIKTVKPTNQIN